MSKLTAEKCREQFEEWLESNSLNKNRDKRGVYEAGYCQAAWRGWQASRQSLEIALPVLEQQEKESTTPQIDNDGWVEWTGGRQPLPSSTPVEVKFRNGVTDRNDNAGGWGWECIPDEPRYYDIIAYRVIENDGREG